MIREILIGSLLIGNVMADDLSDMIRRHEGTVSTVYGDSLKKPTVGIGHLVKKGEKFNKELSNKEIESLFQKDLNKAKQGAQQIIRSNKLDLSKAQVNALTDMVFQMGKEGVSKFKKTISLLKQGKNKEAAQESLKSEWAKQTPNRAKEISNLLKQGKDMRRLQQLKEIKKKIEANKSVLGSNTTPIVGLGIPFEEPTESISPPILKSIPQEISRAPTSEEASEEIGRAQLQQKVRPDPNKQDSTMSQFKQALTYLGPRFVAQLIGGNDAMARTDAILKDVDKFQMAHAEKQMTPFEKEKIRIEDDKIKIQRGQLGTQQIKSFEKRQAKNEAESTELSRMTATMDTYNKTMKDLVSGLDFVGAAHFAPGKTYESVLATFGKEEGIALQRLKEIQLTEVMKAVALTKGAVSNKEMELFAKRAPSFSASKGGWISWIEEKSEAMEKVRYRVHHKLDYRNKEDEKELENHMKQFRVTQQQKFYGSPQQGNAASSNIEERSVNMVNILEGK